MYVLRLASAETGARICSPQKKIGRRLEEIRSAGARYAGKFTIEGKGLEEKERTPRVGSGPGNESGIIYSEYFLWKANCLMLNLQNADYKTVD